MDDKLYKFMNWPRIEGIVYSEENDPFGILGPKQVTKSQVLFQMFYPGATRAFLHILDGKEKGSFTREMEMVDEAGYFAALIVASSIPAYEYKVVTPDREETFEDPYAYELSYVDEKFLDAFRAGTNNRLYEKFGAHVVYRDGKVTGTCFTLWAPGAKRVSVVGDFNHWNNLRHQMQQIPGTGIFQLYIPGAGIGDHYKYELKIKGDVTFMRNDPFAFSLEPKLEGASVISDELTNVVNYKRTGTRKELIPQMSVLQLNLSSFGKNEDGSYLSYGEMGDKIIRQLQQFHYNYVELSPLMEYIEEECGGFQTDGFFAPTSRYGSAKELQQMIAAIHEAGFRVILDMALFHFPASEYGLNNFDGTCLYEHLDPKRGIHPRYGTRLFQYGKPEVRNYLLSVVMFWVTRFCLDGIRLDNVASMLYLDYERAEGEWLANIYGGNEDLDAIGFLKENNAQLHKAFPDLITIAEADTTFPGITDEGEDGLGFDLKWGESWANALMEFMRRPSGLRARCLNDLTLSSVYQYAEKNILGMSNYIMPDGILSLTSNLPRPGGREMGSLDLWGNIRLMLAYETFYPGKNMLFVKDPDTWPEEFRTFIAALNGFYHQHPALYEMDFDPEGFRFINALGNIYGCISFARRSQKEELIILCNFADRSATVDIGVPENGSYKELFNTDGKEFGGSGFVNPRRKSCMEKTTDSYPYTLRIKIAAFSAAVFERKSLS
ncbi:MAG: alpha amylase C-terminal domain-containing protein [Lachnospiraceae bacterium]|nr:alpha amylase C-terminal domain-containing protein [Lachnospiraceae bacterium]